MVTPNTMRPLVRSCSRMLMMGSRAAAFAALGGVAIQASCLLAGERHRSDARETRRRFARLRAPLQVWPARRDVRPRRRPKARTASAHDRVCARGNPRRSGAAEPSYSYFIEGMADRLLDPVRHSARVGHRGAPTTGTGRSTPVEAVGLRSTEWPGAELNRRRRDFSRAVGNHASLLSVARYAADRSRWVLFYRFGQRLPARCPGTRYSLKLRSLRPLAKSRPAHHPYPSVRMGPCPT